MDEDDEKGVPQAVFSQGQDVYIIYSFEDVAFHWQHNTHLVFRRFKGTNRESKTVHSNRLFCDALMGGRLATKAEYVKY